MKLKKEQINDMIGCGFDGDECISFDIDDCNKLWEKAKKEVLDDIDETFHLNDTKAIRLYAECNCCSRFVKKLLEVKDKHLNTNNTDSKNKEVD